MKINMKINLSPKSMDVLMLILANGGSIGKNGFGREGRALERHGLVTKTKEKDRYKITAVGRKYVAKIAS